MTKRNWTAAMRRAALPPATASVISDDDMTTCSFTPDTYEALREQPRKNCSPISRCGTGASFLSSYKMWMSSVALFLLRMASRLYSLARDPGGDDVEGIKLEITEETPSAWDKLFQTFENITSLEEIRIGGFNIGPSVMTRLVQALPNVNEISLFLP